MWLRIIYTSSLFPVDGADAYTSYWLGGSDFYGGKIVRDDLVLFLPFWTTSMCVYVGRGGPPHPFSNILLWRGGDFPMGQWGPVHVHAVGGGRTEQQRRWGDLYKFCLSFLDGSALVLITILSLSWCLLPGLHRHEQPQLLQLAGPRLCHKVETKYMIMYQIW